ncbi:hypothetical protein [Chryseobacterium foetidum]|uniref:hypothetical protein n=1 Tax=Chryseobacterium foetidum TaxID=2951057 RepID=UPI0021C9413A|nr:hypothetical protein [Chryseobacterium foetidum]
MNKIQYLTALLLTIFLTKCKNSEVVQYKVGQEWNYHTRNEEENSTLKILKIEEYPEQGKVIHISIGGLNVDSSKGEKDLSNEITHIPITEEALHKSITELKNAKVRLPNKIEGYDFWKKEFDKGEAGVFSIPVSEIVASFEAAIITGEGYTE